MATGTGGTTRELADDPIHFDHDDFQGTVSDAADTKITKDNNSTETAASLVDEMKTVIAEAVEEARKLGTAVKNMDDATAAWMEASTAAEKETAKKGVLEAMDALEAAKVEYDRRETEILAKIADILARMDGITDGDGEGTDDPSKDGGWRDDQDPTKPKSDNPGSPSSDKPGDSPSSDSPSDSPSVQTKLSSDTSPTAQQQSQQAQVQAQPQQAQQQQPSMGMSSAGMPQQSSPSASPSAFNGLRPRDKDKDRDKPKDEDKDTDALPVATAVPAAVPIDRGTSGTGVTTRDISGKPSTSLSTAGQVPGAAAANGARGGGGMGGMMGAPPPIGGGSKSDTSAKRGKNFDLESLFTKPDKDDQRVNSGTLSKGSLAATEKEREDEKDRVQKAMRDSVKRMMMDKKAG